MGHGLIVPAILAGYLLLPLGVAFGLLYFGIKRRGERPPVDFLLRREPGETLRRKIASMDEDMVFNLMWIAALPLGLGLTVLVIVLKFQPHAVFLGLLLGTGLLVLGMVAICVWLIRFTTKRRNYLLGYLGERAVAQELEPLSKEGFHIYHDLPVEKSSFSFNIDHVVVGPTGLFAIETKTRRKGRAREGYAEHKVFYDGRQLIWPWGEDTFGLKQARNEADWLTKWVKDITGISVVAKPVLALPGWWVETKALGSVSVQNAKNLNTYIQGKGIRILDQGQIDLIARQLDARCRDVQD